MMKPENNPLPREIAPGIFWLGICHEQNHKGKAYHSYNAAYLLVGSEGSMLIETGHLVDFPVVSLQVRNILAERSSTLTHLFLSHQEVPHAGGIGRMLDSYPDLMVHCDVSDYHLCFPEEAHRMRHMEIGDVVDLGDRQFIAVEPVIRDLRTSLWGFDTGARALFPGDGFAYSHYHWDGHCGQVAEEATSLDLVEVLGVFAERALYWTRFADMNVYSDRLEALIEEFDVAVVAPSHGLPILDLSVTMPKVREGLIAGNF